jgi:hypothetical protein
MDPTAPTTADRPAAPAAAPQRQASRWGIGLLAIGGGVLVVVGALLPWLSVFAGLKTYAGVAGLNGRLLLAGGALGALGGLGYLASGRPALRWGLGLWGFMLLAFAGWLIVQLLATYQHAAANPFLLSTLGPGLFVATAGTAAMAATLPIGPTRSAEVPHPGPLGTRPLASVVAVDLALLSGAAAIIHFAVIGQHLRESWLLGAFFAVVALAQLVWAPLVMARPSQHLWLAGAVGNAVAVVVWIVSRTLGLPLGAEAGHAQPVGFADALSTVYEALLVVGAAALARSATRRELRSGWARTTTWAVGVVVVALALLAALNAVGTLSLDRHP